MRQIRTWLKPALVAIGLAVALSGCIAYVGPGDDPDDIFTRAGGRPQKAIRSARKEGCSARS